MPQVFELRRRSEGEDDTREGQQPAQDARMNRHATLDCLRVLWNDKQTVKATKGRETTNA